MALLIASNVLVLVLALVQKWNVADLIWIYWFQSVFIGFFTVVNIVLLKNPAQLAAHPVGWVLILFYKLFVAGFFALHFGGFHTIYAVFLKDLIPAPSPDIVLVGAAIFLIEQWIDFVIRWFKHRLPFTEGGELFTMPYARIIPMHFVIFLLAIFYTKMPQVVMIGFLILRTIMDVVSNDKTSKA